MSSSPSSISTSYPSVVVVVLGLTSLSSSEPESPNSADSPARPPADVGPESDSSRRDILHHPFTRPSLLRLEFEWSVVVVVAEDPALVLLFTVVAVVKPKGHLFHNAPR